MNSGSWVSYVLIATRDPKELQRAARLRVGHQARRLGVLATIQIWVRGTLDGVDCRDLADDAWCWCSGQYESESENVSGIPVLALGAFPSYDVPSITSVVTNP